MMQFDAILQMWVNLYQLYKKTTILCIDAIDPNAMQLNRQSTYLWGEDLNACF